MKTIIEVIRPLVPTLLVLTNFATSAMAQDVSIPDPGLNAAIRAALQKPNGPLTEQDLLGLTDLDACCRNIRDLQGLDVARNLTFLDLQSNRLANVSLPATLTNLNYVDLSFNPLTNCVFPGSLADLSGINIEGSDLASLTLPSGLRRLTALSLHGNRLTSLNLPNDLTGLDFLDVSGNGFTNLNLPSGLRALIVFEAWGNRLTSLTLPTDMTNLLLLDLFFNQLTNVTLPANLRTLGTLDLDGNNFSHFALPPNLVRLAHLNLRDNQLTNVTLLGGMTNLMFLDLELNQLPEFTLPPGAIRLNSLRLSSNKLTSLTLPQGLTNLTTLFLRFNQLTNLTLPPDLTRLVQIDVLGNQLGSLTLPSDMTNLSTLVLDGNPLVTLILSEQLAATNLAGTVASLRNRGVTVITFPLAAEVPIPDPGLNAAIRETLQKPNGPLTAQDLLSLTNLDAGFREVSSVEGLAAARHLERLFLDSNRLTNFSLPAILTNLIELHLSDNPLTNCSLPDGLANLATLNIEFCSLTQLALPAGLTALTQLDLGANGLTSFAVPADATNLASLSLFFNQLTNLTLTPGLTRLAALDLDGNKLTHLILPSDLTNLGGLLLRDNQLSDFILPAGLSRLNFLALDGNQLTQFIFPPGLTNLSFVGLTGNQLTSVTLPPDLTQLDAIFVDGNPFTTLVLSEPLATTSLAGTVALLRNRGVSVFTYPLAVQLVRPQMVSGAFRIGITGPPGIYTILESTDLTAWNFLGMANNTLGSVNFTDVTANASPRKFYRARAQTPPPRMVFIAPNTFTMGSPTNEVDRSINEGPQTTVTLSRGFWIGKYEVTQGEYLSIMNTNPSPFPGDLSRPVSSVSWQDATNYCAKLTLRDLAATRIPAGSHYRLPTEAEWECAARAGTTTRFSYGDDPDYASVGSHAWHAANSGLTAHPVGLKLPNPWGLYDMEGNVAEWCQDWAGSLLGGVQIDPTGPASSTSGRKVTRGGAFDNTQQFCRSAHRSFFPAGPSNSDTDLGFRVVLVTGP